MSAFGKKSPPSVTLPPALAIGFTGHRTLSDEAMCRTAIRKALSDWKAMAPGVVYGVSSTAAGGDLLFAETCIDLGLPVRIFLPSPKEQFRNDFDDSTWERAERVLAKALSVDVMGVSEGAAQRYYECGIETIQQSQLLVALWDGNRARGMGGTADMVYFAADQGRPVVWINSATGAVQNLNEDKGLLHDIEMDFLNGLTEPRVRKQIDTPQKLAEAWFSKVDENANHFAPMFRRLAAIPIVCTAAAALLTGRVSFAGESNIWLWMGTILGIMAGALPFLMRLTHRQILWTRVRTAAEVCRSSLALWATPTIYDAVGPETIPELAGMLTSLNFLKMSDPAWRQTTLDDFKQAYRRDRVQHQIEYFSRHASHSAVGVRRYQGVIWVSVFFAASLNLWIVWKAHGPNRLSLGPWKLALALAAATCFQIATAAGALLVVNDHQRRRERYREVHRMLVQWDKQLELSETWPIVLRITSKVEKVLLAELIEWRSLIRNRKVPRK